MMLHAMPWAICVTFCFAAAAGANDGVGRESNSDTPTDQTLAQRGYQLLTTKAYLAPDFDQQVFDELWQSWEPGLRKAAAAATPEARRKMAFDRYGLLENTDRGDGSALQYVRDEAGNWVMSCLACHQGKVAGQIVPGVPNTLYALETLTEDVLATKLRLKKELTHMDLGSLAMPLGGSVGTTNAVMFGVALLAHRDPDLNVHKDLARPKMVHHDMDAPPWWNVKKKSRLYADGFVAKGHRAIMQFLLIPENGPDEFWAWEDDYRAIAAYIDSLQPPAWPFEVDRGLASFGEQVFNRSCARCHGTYGASESWPEVTVPMDEVGTDRVRFESISAEGRARYERSWFNHHGEKHGDASPVGYVAPPLDGVWASAPYLHNGSVPTLWHLFHADKRPVVWRRSPDGYDQQRVGLKVDVFDQVPRTESRAEFRTYFDTRRYGKSAVGHLFPDELSEDEKLAVLEYLKTL